MGTFLLAEFPLIYLYGDLLLNLEWAAFGNGEES